VFLQNKWVTKCQKKTNMIANGEMSKDIYSTRSHYYYVVVSYVGHFFRTNSCNDLLADVGTFD
jgi:hypothetical protein